MIFSFSAFSQGIFINPISTYVPFLACNPDARSGGFADINVVSPSFYSSVTTCSNPGLFSDGKFLDFEYSYMPLDRDINEDYKFHQLSLSFKLNSRNAISFGAKYNKQANIVFTDIVGNPTGTNKPKEFCYDMKFTHAFSDNWSGGIGIKYYSSDLFGDNYISAMKTQDVKSFAIDLGTVYQNNVKMSESSQINYSYGASLTNFGPKINYFAEPYAQYNFIPTNLQLGLIFGPQFKTDLNMNFNIDFAYQVEKLLVPTPPEYSPDLVDENGKPVIISGKDPDISPLTALYQSFYDAPGGLSEELNEFIHRSAIEFRLSDNSNSYAALRYGIIVISNSDKNIYVNTIGFGGGYKGLYVNYRRVFNNYELYKNAFSIGFRINDIFKTEDINNN